ncbi:UAA transporter [Lophium mytilinum]|uniref:UDP-galactose transporter homolog 1 n=1 Tax=Lophium mytilinum TaxID=390894 RepID=A0A6A6RHH6_9PEZI|nr:UAA transporter [Lophium mytilinum]
MGLNGNANGNAKGTRQEDAEPKQAGLTQLAICIGGIYMSFLTWALLQERIHTTTYGPKSQKFNYSVFLNTVQSALAALTGYVYLYLSAPKNASGRSIPPIFPSRAILLPLSLIAVTSSLASPFGYASLKHLDYITFILAKSCKLLPVMFLHLTVFQKRYPIYKYMVVAMVTLGVAVFTLHHPSTAKKASKSTNLNGNSNLGLFLLGVNLLFDGVTNTVQDNIFTTYRPYTGPQMMCAQNIMATLLTVSYLFLSPYLAATGLGDWFGLSSNGGELKEALNFVTTYPDVGWEVLGFGVCGAVGQVFIFYTLSHFSSLLLVTVTVTRKMLTMLLSVVWFGHVISGMQWVGVSLVFGGVGFEGLITRREKLAKERAKKEAAIKKGGKKEL